MYKSCCIPTPPIPKSQSKKCIQETNHLQNLHDGTPSYTNPFSALFCLRFLDFFFPVNFDTTVRIVTTRTIIAAIVGTCLPHINNNPLEKG